MFSICDLDRYRRWPLAWVFGPLILGGLLVATPAFDHDRAHLSGKDGRCIDRTTAG